MDMGLIEILKVLRRNAYLMLGSRDDADAHLAVLLSDPETVLVLHSLATLAALKMLYHRLPRWISTAPDPAVAQLCALPFYNRAVVVLVAVQGLGRAAAAHILSISEQAVADLLAVGMGSLMPGAEGTPAKDVPQEPRRPPAPADAG